MNLNLNLNLNPRASLNLNLNPGLDSDSVDSKQHFRSTHGMKVVTVDCGRQEDTIRQITGQNPHLRSKIEILHV